MKNYKYSYTIYDYITYTCLQLWNNNARLEPYKEFVCICTFLEHF